MIGGCRERTRRPPMISRWTVRGFYLVSSVRLRRSAPRTTSGNSGHVIGAEVERRNRTPGRFRRAHRGDEIAGVAALAARGVARRS